MTDTDLTDDDVERRTICEPCVGEEYLCAEIRRDGVIALCSYCGKTAKVISIGELADYVDRAIEQHYYRTPDEAEGIDLLMLKEGGIWEREGEPAVDVIAQMAGIDEAPAEHVREVLAERVVFDKAEIGVEDPFDEDAHYVEGPVLDHELQALWSYFQKSLQTESRLFNRGAEDSLDSIFEGLADYQTLDGKSVLVEVGPEKEISVLHRARVFQSDKKLESAISRPDLELGPPPSNSAAAGRMNAQGISVFYGATDPHIALAETRPPVGSKVLVGSFEVTGPLQLLDIEALSRVRVTGSVFDPSFLPALEKAKFLESLSDRIAKPVMPNDELFDYLVTQAIAEYLAARRDPSIDGIIYPSVQSGKERNIVLFHKAARVAELEIPRGTDLRASLGFSTEDDFDPDYTVWEEIPPEEKEKETSIGPPLFLATFRDFPSEEDDVREPSLKVVIDSIAVHHVKNITFGTQKHSVSRHRLTRSERKF